MKKGKSVMGKVLACAFVLLILVLVFAGVVPVVAATTWTVDDSGGADFTSIQAAGNAASPGDTIIVYPGTYTENVDVNKPHLTIQSESGADSTIVQVASSSDHVFGITEDYVNISGFTVKGGDSGFEVGFTGYCTISDCVIANNKNGIYLHGTNTNLTLRSLNITSPFQCGIYLNSGTMTNLRIEDVSISNAGSSGIKDSNNPNLNGLTIKDTLISSPGGYGVELPNYHAWIKDVYIDNVTVTDAAVSGIWVSHRYTDNSRNVTIVNSKVSNSSQYGILLGYTEGEIRLENNTVEGAGSGYGVYINGDRKPTLTFYNNTVKNNANGVYISGVNFGNPLSYPNNDIATNAGNIIHILHSTNATLEGYTFDDATMSYSTALNLDSVTDIIAKNLTIINPSENAVYLGTNTNLTLRSLNITSPFQCGIYLNSGTMTNLRIEDVSISNAGSSGIKDSNNPNLNGLTIKDTLISSPGGYGVELPNYHAWIKDVYIDNVTVTDAALSGIYVDMRNINSRNVTITNLKVSNSTQYGMYLSSFNDNTITNNIVSDNNIAGIYISGSNNEIYLNNFINNTLNAQSQNNNHWNSPQPITYTYNDSEYVNYLGNYWDDYTGLDENGDGIGDTEYVINGDGDCYPLMQPFEGYIIPPTTEVIMNETASSTHTLFETITSQNATLNTSVTGDLNGTLNFTDLEIVLINTGYFNGKGFSKGNWSANIEGSLYNGQWEGMLFKKPEERKIHLKGRVSGGLKGIVEGYSTESVNGSGVYDQYQATWTISHIDTDIVFATLDVNGTVHYQESSEYSSELYALQTSINGEALGYYNGSLSIVLTHVRIDNETNPYHSEGFSIISYVSEYGSGEGWTYNGLVSPNISQLNGLFANPLMGIVSGTLDESELSRTLSMSIERIDLGLPPMADLNVRVWGPGSVSPGATIDYILEYRNYGLKGAKDKEIVIMLPRNMSYISNTGVGTYSSETHRVIWKRDIPAKSNEILSAKGSVLWGLPFHTFIVGIGYIRDKSDFQEDPTANITISEIHVLTDKLLNITLNVSNATLRGNMNLNISIADAKGEIEPKFEVKEYNDEIEYFFEYTIRLNPLYDVVIVIKSGKDIIDIVKNIKEVKDMHSEKKERMKFIDCLRSNGWIDDSQSAILKKSAEGRFLAGASAKAPIWGEIPSGFVFQKVVGEVKDMFWKRTVGSYLEAWCVLNAENLGPFYGITIKEDQLYNKAFEFCNGGDSVKSEIWAPHDPNIKYGLEGFVLPCQKLNYTVEYENEGEGIAFGVYFTDTLDEDLDDSTLEIGPVISTINGSVIAPPGIYDQGTRTITWFVGEVGPREGGYANLSADVRSDAEEGTEIINYATVYFPSVPEETRTNGIVSIVDTAPPGYSNVGQSKSEVTAGESVEVYAYWQDGVQLNYTWLETNESGTWENVSYLELSGNEAWGNFTIQTTQEGVVCWRIHANDAAGNGNVTPMFCVDVLPPPLPPIALFNYTPLTPVVGELITFNASQSYDPDGFITKYEWDFGDGNITNTTEGIITHSYSLAGNYMVNLTATDNDGVINLTSKVVPVQVVDTTPPLVTNPGANPPSIIADGIQETQLNVTVTDESGIASVTVNLSDIGGSPTQEMNNISGTDVYTVNTTAAMGTAPDTYFLQVNATDIYGNSYTSVSIALTVTEVADTILPASVSDLSETASGTSWILWKWTNPPEPDFNHVEVWINGEFKANITTPEHSYNATGLSPNTTYEIGTRTVDDSGNINLTWVNDTAKTSLAPDTTPPVITNVTAVNVTINSAIIAWNTNEASDSLIKYGTESGNYTLQKYDSQKVTLHRVNLIGLLPNTTYYFVVNSTDQSGNSNESMEYSFITLVTAEVIPANIVIKPETLNLKSKGVFSAFITLPEPYNITDINISTVVCEEAPAVKGMAAGDNKYIAKFDREDLRDDLPTGDEVEMRVTGKVFYNGGYVDFEGSDTIRVIDKGKGGK